MGSEQPKKELSKATVRSVAHGSVLIRRTLTDIKALEQRQPRKPRIIITDDEARILQVYESIFELYCQATVVTTTNSLTALKWAIEDPPDLFITDVMHPGLPTLDMIKILRHEARTRSVPIWVITGVGDVSGGAALLEAGANLVIVKPPAVDDLVRRANQLFLKG